MRNINGNSNNENNNNNKNNQKDDGRMERKIDADVTTKGKESIHKKIQTQKEKKSSSESEQNKNKNKIILYKSREVFEYFSNRCALVICRILFFELHTFWSFMVLLSLFRFGQRVFFNLTKTIHSIESIFLILIHLCLVCGNVMSWSRSWITPNHTNHVFCSLRLALIKVYWNVWHLMNFWFVFFFFRFS